MKKILLVTGILLAGGIVWFYLQWNKAAPQAENQETIVVSASRLYEDYQANAKSADGKYLDHWLEVSGTVQGTEINQDGEQVLVLETGDLMQAIVCTMRKEVGIIANGDQITIIGRCVGLVNDIVLTECIEKN